MAESAAIPYLSEDEAGSLVTLPMLLRAAERFFSGPERPPLREEAAAGDFRLLTGGEDGLLLTGWLRPDGGAGVLCAAERESGAPRLLLPLRPLLQLAARTGHSLLAASRLCRRPPRHIAFLGSGPALLQSVSAFDALFEPNCINIFCGDRAGVERCRALLHNRVESPVYFSRTTKEAVAAADLIVCGGEEQPPALLAEWLAPGVTIVACTLHNALPPELPGQLDKWVLGCRDFDLPRLRAVPGLSQAGEKSIRGDLAGLLSGALPGRETEEESILYTHDGAVGLALPLAAEICRAYFAQRQADRAKTSKHDSEKRKTLWVSE
ncbi:hypothetical protein [Lawsonibacter faecis]|uniref:Ornithine cyclodeaminase n=1 Tax=Lawsonibacter faecis TaxID=2763052 RepID=A0A8J6MFS4_9FIRM|nr:hypothetical protein [Lawsonibacter faecis]MBC5735693.1 hypothetical protein [Lawsonibacter faecis]